MVIFKKNIYIQNGTFQKFLKSKFDPNILQKRTKLHHFKNIFGLACPRTPLAKRISKSISNQFPNLKINSCPPPKSWLRPWFYLGQCCPGEGGCHCF